MTVIAVGSLKGSPGVTTLAMALAASWPRERVLLAEVDPAGGDLASRFQLPPDPGLLSLAAAARREPRIHEHCQRLPGRLMVLAAPPSSEPTAWGVGVVAELVFPGLVVARDVDVIADCGRLDARSPALAIARAAQVLVVVARPVLAELNHLSSRLPSLQSGTADVWLVLVGRGTWKPAEVSQGLGLPVAAEIPVDGVGAALLGGAGRSGSRSATRLPLVRQARTIAERLATQVLAVAGPGQISAGPPPPPSPPQLSPSEAVS